MTPRPVRSVREVGEYIREQRAAAQVSLRQLARLAGVSNPYLSQIERGLRKPSAEILQQIAKALRISAEQLYIQAGILTERESGTEVVAAVLADAGLSERQKHVLLEIYESFRRENSARDVGHPADEDATPDGPTEPDGSGEEPEQPEAADEPGAAAGEPAAASVRLATPVSEEAGPAGDTGDSEGEGAAAPAPRARSAS